MAFYIIRRSREHAEYLLWSTVTDRPVTMPLGQPALTALLAQIGCDYSPERFARADHDGGSAHNGFGHWDDDEYDIFHDAQMRPYGQEATRERLFALAAGWYDPVTTLEAIGQDEGILGAVAGKFEAIGFRVLPAREVR